MRSGINDPRIKGLLQHVSVSTWNLTMIMPNFPGKIELYMVYFIHKEEILYNQFPLIFGFDF
jgi:hypothetical protein